MYLFMMNETYSNHGVHTQKDIKKYSKMLTIAVSKWWVYMGSSIYIKA